MNDKELKLHLELEETKHKNRLSELEFERKTHTIIHQNSLERQRIKSAEERKKYSRLEHLREMELKVIKERRQG